MAYTALGLERLALRLIQEAEQKQARLRLLGGLAFYVASPSAAKNPVLRRDYKDLDFVVNERGAGVLPDVFEDQGWEADRRFNALHGAKRMLFYYREEIQADIFVGIFEQCHKLVLDDRLKLNPTTLPLADLVLTKLQIHQLNVKDANDVFTLLLSVDLVSGPSGNQIDLSYIVGLTSNDWGWYTTLHDNLTFLEGALPKDLKPQEQKIIRSKLKALKDAIEAAPKSVRWKVRNQIGKRIAWYDEPEEVHR